MAASDSAVLFLVGELDEVAGRLDLPIVTVVGVDFQCRLEVRVYKRTPRHGETTETGVHRSKEEAFEKIAFASGKPTVIHVPIDPVADHGANENTDTPNYDEFRTWYAEGKQ